MLLIWVVNVARKLLIFFLFLWMDLLVVASMHYFAIKKKSQIKEIRGIKSPGKLKAEDVDSHLESEDVKN